MIDEERQTGRTLTDQRVEEGVPAMSEFDEYKKARMMQVLSIELFALEAESDSELTRMQAGFLEAMLSLLDLVEATDRRVDELIAAAAERRADEPTEANKGKGHCL